MMTKDPPSIQSNQNSKHTLKIRSTQLTLESSFIVSESYNIDVAFRWLLLEGVQISFNKAKMSDKSEKRFKVSKRL